jgi:hypothetical protein
MSGRLAGQNLRHPSLPRRSLTIGRTLIPAQVNLVLLYSMICWTNYFCALHYATFILHNYFYFGIHFPMTMPGRRDDTIGSAAGTDNSVRPSYTEGDV